MSRRTKDEIKKVVKEILREQKKRPKTAKVLRMMITNAEEAAIHAEIDAGSAQGVSVSPTSRDEVKSDPHKMKGWPRLWVRVIKTLPMRSIIKITGRPDDIAGINDAHEKGRRQVILFDAYTKQAAGEEAGAIREKDRRQNCLDMGGAPNIDENGNFVCSPAEGGGAKVTVKRKKRGKLCGPRGHEVPKGKKYGQRSWKPAKLKSKAPDPEYDRFYEDLKRHGLSGKLGDKHGEDYWWGWRHKRAYRALLCKAKDLGKSKKKPAGTKSEVAPCHDINKRQFALMNKNRMYYGLKVVTPEECNKLALIRSGEYVGLTEPEVKIIQGMKIGFNRAVSGKNATWRPSQGYVAYRGKKYDLDVITRAMFPKLNTYKDLIRHSRTKGIPDERVQKAMTNYIDSQLQGGAATDILYKG